MSAWTPNPKELAKTPSLLTPGHRLCPGCAASVIGRLVLYACPGPILIAHATGCFEVATTIFPYTCWRTSWIHNAFENAAATVSGMVEAWKVLQKRGAVPSERVYFLVFGGDGGTYDIGIQALSGAFERGHDFLYVLYDNEAYMNTGIQRSGGTPKGAWTTTTPAGRVIPGKPQWKKPIADIAVAHRIPYVATASPAYWMDLMRKARKGFEVEGPAFIHAISPCPRGWRYPPEKTIEVARLAVDTCFFPLWEYENGEWLLTDRSLAIAKNPNLKKPVIEYLKIQGRFRHLLKPENKHIVDAMQQTVDAIWEDLLKRCGLA